MAAVQNTVIERRVRASRSEITCVGDPLLEESVKARDVRSQVTQTAAEDQSAADQGNHEHAIGRAVVSQITVLREDPFYVITLARSPRLLSLIGGNDASRSEQLLVFSYTFSFRQIGCTTLVSTPSCLQAFD